MCFAPDRKSESRAALETTEDSPRDAAQIRSVWLRRAECKRRQPQGKKRGAARTSESDRRNIARWVARRSVRGRCAKGGRVRERRRSVRNTRAFPVLFRDIRSRGARG